MGENHPMSENLHEISRRELQQHYERLIRCNHSIKLLQLKYLWKYLHKSPAFSPLLDDIKANNTRLSGFAWSIFHNQQLQDLPDNYLERVYVTYFIFEIMLNDGHEQHPMSIIGGKYNRDTNENDPQINFSIFNDLFLEPFVFFFLNQIDRSLFILGLLKKYKHRSEWFNKEKLHAFLEKSSIAEKLLKQNLCKYLYDNGGELYMEPSSPSGEVDLVAIDNSSAQKALIEAKIFDADRRNKSYIISGYHQAETYLKDHGQSKGYLVIYNTCPQLLSINANPSTSFPYINRDNRLIYFVIVDIFQHDKSASKRKPTINLELKESDFLE